MVETFRVRKRVGAFDVAAVDQIPDHQLYDLSGLGSRQVRNGYDDAGHVTRDPGGRCAVLRYPGNTHNREPAALYLYSDWLPASREEARDFPIYCQRRLSFLPDVAIHDAVVEVFLPLK